MLTAEAGAIALCGAGISMPPPTSLPSGNALRDICVSHLLREDKNSELVDRLLGSPAYQALLPEAVLQEVGYFAQDHIDRLLSVLLSMSTPNPLHGSISDRFTEIFTTNFDNCFELSGAQKVHHLHGSINQPASLQSGLWRLGKTAVGAMEAFKERAQTSTIFVTGYSLRDADVCTALAASSSLKLMYLSYTTETPRILATLPGEVTCAIGGLEQVLPLRIAAEVAVRRPDVRVRQPAQGLKALALMYLYGTLGDTDALRELQTLYRAHLKGRDLLRAKGVLADTLRASQRFTEAFNVCLGATKLPSYRRDSNLDLQSYLLTLMGLCEHEGSAHRDRARSLFRRALRAMNEFGRRDRAAQTPVRVAVWRAKIANNLGNVERDEGRHLRAEKLYRLSINAKLAHGEEGAAAQTYSNLSVLQIDLGRLEEASRSLTPVLEAMHKSPEAYLCRSAIYDNVIALVHHLGGPIENVVFGAVNIDEVEYFARGSVDDVPAALTIVDQLRDLQMILNRLSL